MTGKSSDELQNQHFPKVCNADGLHLGKWSPSFHLFLFQRTFSICKPLQNANVENFEMKCKLNLERSLTKECRDKACLVSTPDKPVLN